MAHHQGIDVSSHQGQINWSLVKKQKSFVIVRAGYGNLDGVRTHIDPRAREYIRGAKASGVEVIGIYWYSYTRTPYYATIEANRACEFLREMDLKVPIFFDFELAYEGYDNTDEEVRSFCTAFTETVRNNGFTAGVYFDPNYYRKYGRAFIGNLRANGVKIWYAAWSIPEPDIQCDIWQYTSSGVVQGITGNVDLNIFYGKLKNKKKFPIIYYSRVF